jgi:hypothetical protein
MVYASASTGGPTVHVARARARACWFYEKLHGLIWLTSMILSLNIMVFKIPTLNFGKFVRTFFKNLIRVHKCNIILTFLYLPNRRSPRASPKLLHATAAYRQIICGSHRRQISG